jgi:hypothetical protein
VAAEVALRVSRAYQEAPHVVAAWPYASALAACLGLVRADRDAALTREAEQLRGARYVNAAMLSPDGYADALRAFEARARGPVRPSVAHEPGAGAAMLIEAVAMGWFAQAPEPTEAASQPAPLEG